MTDEREALRERIAKVIGEVFDSGAFDGAHRDHHLAAADAVLAVLPSRETECGALSEDGWGRTDRCEFPAGHRGHHAWWNIPSRETRLPHIVTASDGTAYPCSCPVLADHPVLGITPEEYVAQLALRETVAPTREVVRQQIMRAWERHPNSPPNVFDRAADYVLALFPGDSREAVEAKARAEVIDWMESNCDFEGYGAMGPQEAREHFGIEADHA